MTDVPIDPALARQLRAVGRRLKADKDKRAALIRQASDEGASLREVANLVGLTHVAVLKIIKSVKP